jgi:predicted RNase H-like HicB family nuclease
MRKEKTMLFKVMLSPDLEDGGFNVSCPALPGCHSKGDTEEEAIENIKEAITGCL